MCGREALLSALLLFAAGCRNCDLVEAELRTREREIRELAADMTRVEAENEALHRELRSVRQSSAPPTVEEASQTNTVRQIVLGRQTGSYDNDHSPGDEALMVVCEPRDADGHPLKVPGSLCVEAVEINPQGLKSLLSSWDVSPAELRRTWRSGLLSSGYHVVLPWKTWPTSERLRVTARLTLPDGRAFEADRDVRVRLGPVAPHKSTPVSEPVLPKPRMHEPGPELNRDELRRDGLERTALWNGPRASLIDAVRLEKPLPVKPFYPQAWRP